MDPDEPPPQGNDFYGMSLQKIEDTIQWKRADAILKATIDQRMPRNPAINHEKVKQAKHMYLYAHGISPNDVVQGQLGDCWVGVGEKMGLRL